MTVELADEYDITVQGDDYSGKVYQLQINGNMEDPESVTVVLNTGIQFEIPWNQYERGVGE